MLVVDFVSTSQQRSYLLLFFVCFVVEFVLLNALDKNTVLNFLGLKTLKIFPKATPKDSRFAK